MDGSDSVRDPNPASIPDHASVATSSMRECNSAVC
jgi:hypothetical protein